MKFSLRLLMTITILTIALFTISNCELVSAKTFPDVDPASEVGIAVNKLSTLGIVSGKPNGNYAPNDIITRAEAAQIMYGVLELDAYANETGVQIFPDVKTSHWAYKVIATIYDWDIMTGYTNGKFGPNDKLTRGQMAHLLSNALKLPAGPSTLPFKDVKKTAYYYNGVASLYAQGITKGKSATTFEPNSFITRAELAAFLDRSGVLDTLLGNDTSFDLSPIEAVDGKIINEATFNKIIASYAKDIWGILPTTNQSDIYFNEESLQFENLEPGEAIFDVYFNDYEQPIYLKVTVNDSNVASYQFYTPTTLKTKAQSMSGTTELVKLLQQLMTKNNFNNSEYINQLIYFEDNDSLRYYNYVGDDTFYFELNDTVPFDMYLDFPNGTSYLLTISPYITNGSYHYTVQYEVTQ